MKGLSKAIDLEGMASPKLSRWARLMYKLSDGGGFRLWNVYWRWHMKQRRKGQGWRIGKEQQPLYWYLHRWWQDHGVRAQRSRFRTFRQRGRRGWSDVDVWSLDTYLARVIRDSVLHLRDTDHGHPGDLTPDAWRALLSEVADGMQASIDLADLNYDFKDKAKHQELVDKHERAMDLLKERWFSLWD